MSRAAANLPSGIDFLGNGTVCHSTDQCFCEAWFASRGSNAERDVAVGIQWVTTGMCVLCLLWYAYGAWKTTCGWEEVYVATVEMIKCIIEYFHEFDSPAMLMLSTGNQVVWLRYAEWLLTCPVILIHLSNLTGLSEEYSARTMGLLVSDVGCVVLGISSAMAQGWLRLVFFLIATGYGIYTFYHAAMVYIESYHTVPKGACRNLVRVLAWLFFLTWGFFPILFAIGPEGFGGRRLSQYGSAIGHGVLDIFSKNLWSLLGHTLRVKIHHYVAMYGDNRKKIKIRVLGREIVVDAMVEEEERASSSKLPVRFSWSSSNTVVPLAV